MEKHQPLTEALMEFEALREEYGGRCSEPVMKALKNIHKLIWQVTSPEPSNQQENET